MISLPVPSLETMCQKMLTIHSYEFCNTYVATTYLPRVNAWAYVLQPIYHEWMHGHSTCMSFTMSEWTGIFTCLSMQMNLPCIFKPIYFLIFIYVLSLFLSWWSFFSILRYSIQGNNLQFVLDMYSINADWQVFWMFLCSCNLILFVILKNVLSLRTLQACVVKSYCPFAHWLTITFFSAGW